jgi:hypothetical protein
MYNNLSVRLINEGNEPMTDNDIWQLRNLIAVLALIGAAFASWMLWGLWACVFTACAGLYLSMVGGLLMEAIQIRKP